MQQNDRNFSMQDAIRLAATPAGQQLIALLQQQSDQTAMNQAMEQAKKGDYTKIKETLSPLLASEEVRKLIQQLGG